jgi:uncharacterized membrane protein HdeD (DUF308 family)
VTKFQRLRNIISGIVMLLFSAALLIDPVIGIQLIAIVIGVSLFIMGTRSLVYYFRMAKHMVGGKSMLYRGIILLDAGVFTLSVADNLNAFVVIYLVVVYTFSGVIDILRSFEAKGVGNKTWLRTFMLGIINIEIALLGLLCGLMMESSALVVLIYSMGLMISAVRRIASAFRRTAIVYIQ